MSPLIWPYVIKIKVKIKIGFIGPTTGNSRYNS